MSSSLEALNPDARAYLDALLAAPRPGADKILAFYDNRVGRIGKDPRLLLVPLDDHVVHRGDGLFESICYRDRKIFALDAHMRRLREGSRALAIEPPLSFEEMEKLIVDVARDGGEPHGDLRLFLTRGAGGFGISPVECPTPGLYIVALRAKLPDPEIYKRGLTAFTSVYPPKQEYLARIKNTNYLANVFMATEAARRNMDIAITFDEKGHMGEAAIANVAIIDRDGCLRSPAIERILPGTTLLAALKIAASRMPVREGPIHREELAHAREMLLFTSATLCVPIVSFDGHPVADGKPGPVAAWLKDELLKYMLDTGTPF